MSVADAVVSRHVGTHFAGADDVVRGHGVAGVRQAHVDDGRAQVFQRSRCRPDGLLHVGVHPVDEVLLRQADAHSSDLLRQRRRIVGNRRIARGGVERVGSGDGSQEVRHVFDGLGKGADRIQRTGHAHHAEAAGAAVGDLQSRAAAVRRGLPDGSPRIGPQRKQTLVRRHGRRRSAGGTARNTGRIPGILRHTVAGRLSTAAHGEFISIRFSHADGSRLFQSLRSGGVEGRAVVFIAQNN